MGITSTGLSTAGIRAEFGQRLSEVTAETYWQRLATILQSTSDKESYKWLGSVPPLREWGTGRLAKGVFNESYDIENLKYELTLEVNRDEIDDDQTGQIRLRIKEMAERAGMHKDSEIGRLLNNGHAAGFNSYLGVPFFSSAMPIRKDGSTQSNDITSPGATATAPTVPEFKTAVGSAIQTLLGLKDDQGEALSMGATGLVVAVPVNMLITASEALGATIIASTDNVLKGAADVLPVPQLTALDTFFLLKTNVTVKALVLQDRAPLEFKALEDDSDSGFVREVFLYGVRARYRMTYGRPEFAVRCKFV